MTHATISAYTATLCIVEFGYSELAKSVVKSLPGAEYADKQWIVPILHLPTLKTIFTKLTVEQAVIDAYHRLLRRMVANMKGHERDKGVKGLLDKHALGIAAMQAKEAQLALRLTYNLN